MIHQTILPIFAILMFKMVDWQPFCFFEKWEKLKFSLCLSAYLPWWSSYHHAVSYFHPKWLTGGHFIESWFPRGISRFPGKLVKNAISQLFEIFWNSKMACIITKYGINISQNIKWLHATGFAGRSATLFAQKVLISACFLLISWPYWIFSKRFKKGLGLL